MTTGSSGTERERSRSPLDRLLDVGLFAPLGLLLEKERVVPELAEAGRKQIAFTRSLGRAALKTLAAKQGMSTKTAPPEAADRAVEIEGYDALNAREVIALARECTDAEAVWIRRRETAGKNRVTVLRALDARDG